MHPDDLDDELDEPDDPDGGGIPDWDIEELIRLDKQINEHEADAIRRRWEYGRAMLAGRGDRQRLPKGALNDPGGRDRQQSPRAAIPDEVGRPVPHRGRHVQGVAFAVVRDYPAALDRQAQATQAR